MDLATGIRAALATIRRRPADLLPMYLLTLAAPVIARVFTFAGLVLVLAYLTVTDRIDLFFTELEAIEMTPPDPEGEPEAFLEWLESFEPAVEALVTPTTLGILFFSIGITIAVGIVIAAAIEAGQLAACYGRLRREPGLINGIGGVRNYWLSLLGLYVMELVLWITVTGFAVIVLAAAAAVSLALAVILAIFVVLFWLAAIAAIRAIFVFAPVSVVVDEQSALGSLRQSAGFIRNELMAAAGYYAISLGILFGLASASAAAAPFGGAGLMSLAGILLVTPGLHLLKTALYGDYRDSISPYTDVETRFREQVRNGTGRAFRELGSFIPATPVAHVASAGFLVVGFFAGWLLIEPLDGVVEMSIRARTETIIPPVTALQIFGNNWAVALSAAFSGVAFAIPAIVTLLHNGVMFGAVSRLETELDVLAAFVIPHGILEIPAIVVAGAVGIHLGIAVWRAWRGQMSRNTLAATFERAFWVLIALGFVLALAAAIEGFVSPYYWRLFL